VISLANRGGRGQIGLVAFVGLVARSPGSETLSSIIATVTCGATVRRRLMAGGGSRSNLVGSCPEELPVGAVTLRGRDI